MPVHEVAQDVDFALGHIGVDLNPRDDLDVPVTGRHRRVDSTRVRSGSRQSVIQPLGRIVIGDGDDT